MIVFCLKDVNKLSQNKVLSQALLAKNWSGLQRCENWQFNETKQIANPSNRNQGEKLSLQAIKKTKGTKEK